MIAFIVLHFISSNLYATKNFIKQNNIHSNTRKCYSHNYIHEHVHTHSSSNHLHKHSHSPVNANFFDYYVNFNDTNQFEISLLKEKYFKTIYWLSSPIKESLFRPPIV